MNTSKESGYILIEILIGVIIVSILSVFIGNTFINVTLATNKSRAEKEMYESALNLESLIKIKLKNVNSLSHILFDGIIINSKDMENDVVYEVDGIAFGKFRRNTTAGQAEQFVLAKDMGSSNTIRNVIWFMRLSANEILSEHIIKNRIKYEAGTYVSKIYLERIDKYRYMIILDLKYKEIKGRHSFSFEIL